MLLVRAESNKAISFALNLLYRVVNLGLVFVFRLLCRLVWLRLRGRHGFLGIIDRFAILGCILLRRFFGLCSQLGK